VQSPHLTHACAHKQRKVLRKLKEDMMGADKGIATDAERTLQQIAQPGLVCVWFNAW
jgi:BMFP domain-containing protein YqiC